MFEKFEIIHSYTRAQALEDGELVDVSNLAKEMGFRFPVALTRAAWNACVEIPEGVGCRDETGRLWDVLWCLLVGIRRSGNDSIVFKVLVDNGNQGKAIHTLAGRCHGGDLLEPVITVGFAEDF